MKIGLVIAGIPSWYPTGIVDLIIAEYKTFVESNSLLKLNIVKTYGPRLQDSEFVYDGVGCYFPYPNTLSTSTIALFPTDTDCNILLFDWIGKPPCYGGGTWGYGINNNPFTAIPIGPWSSELTTWDGWSYSVAGTIVHEWLHELDIILERLGYPQLWSSDDCDIPPYNYTDQTDPGWQICYKRILSEITPEMYAALGKCPSQTQVNLFGTCVEKTPILIGGAVFAGLITYTLVS